MYNGETLQNTTNIAPLSAGETIPQLNTSIYCEKVNVAFGAAN